MGGKQKQAQRTKGNTRASSSALAAEFLEASGGGVQGFVGFGGVSGNLGYVPASVTGTDEESASDADFHLVLRKLTKRDATTKLKALQEFSQLCQEKDVEAIKSVLPFWPRTYTKVYTDTDRRVREASGQAFEQLVLRVKKELAPYLKSLMGPWLVAQCDPHQPAAAAAKSAFTAAFSPAKQAQALAFCKVEAFKYLIDMVLNQTALTLSDPKVTEADEMEMKYERVVSSALLAVHLLFTNLQTDQHDAMNEVSAGLFKEAKFWKLAKHKSVMIRSSFYAVIVAYCQMRPELANLSADKICPLVLHNLDESEPLICPKLWEAALHITKTIESCWDKVNLQKGVLPALWRLLRAGGQGNAATIFPSLLPFLSKWPSPSFNFYKEFFTNLQNGLNDERVLVSNTEMSAVIQAYIECLRFCLNKHMGYEEEHVKMQDYLIEQVVSLIETSFTHEKSGISSSPLYSQVVSLHLYLLRLAEKSEEEGKSSPLRVLNLLWESLNSLCVKTVNLSGNEAPTALPRLANFLSSFTKPNTREQQVVRSKTAEEKHSTQVQKGQEDARNWNDYEPLLQIVSQLTLKANDLACADENNVLHLSLLSDLLSHFLCKELLLKLTSNENANKTDEAVLSFFKSFIVPWLDRVSSADSGSPVTPHVVTILQAFFSFAPTEIKLQILPHIYKDVTQGALLEQFTDTVLSECDDPAVLDWYRGPEFSLLLKSVTKELCSAYLHKTDAHVKDADTDANWSLLKVALSAYKESEVLISQSQMDSILQEIMSALPHPPSYKDLQPQQLGGCVEFVCGVANLFFANMPECMALSSAEGLLLALFKLCSQYNSPVPESSMLKAQTAWKLGVKALLRQKGGLLTEEGFLHQAASHMKFKVNNSADTMTRLNWYTKLTTDLVSLVEEELPTSDSGVNGVTKELLNLLCMSYMQDLETEWRTSPVLEGVISINAQPSLTSETPSTTIPKCVAPSAFTACVYASAAKTFPGFSISSGIVMDCCYSLAFCRSVLGKRKSWLHSSELGMVTKQLEESLRQLLLSVEDSTDVVLQILQRSGEKGYLWAVSLGVLLEHLNNIQVSELLQVNDRLNNLTEASLHTLQISSRHLHSSDADITMDILAAQIVSCEDVNVSSLQGGRGFLTALNSFLKAQEGESGDLSSIVNVLDQLVAWRQNLEEHFAFDMEISSLSWEDLMLNVEVMRMLQTVVSKMPSKLNAEHWDFIMCSAVSWIQSTHASWKDVKSSLGVQLLAVSAMNLLSTIAQCMKNVLPHDAQSFPAELGTEWTEFFSEAAYKLMLPLFIQYTNDETMTNLSNMSESLLRSFSLTVSYCPLSLILNHNLQPNLIADQKTSLPNDLQTLLNHFSPFLLAPYRPTQLAAYQILLSVMPSLPEHDLRKTSEELDEEVEPETAIGLPHSVEAVMESSWAIVEDLFNDLKFGETVVLEAHTEEHTATMAYLLAWKLALTFFKSAPFELKAKYAQYLKEQEMLDQLLQHIFHVIPDTPVVQLKESLVTGLGQQRLSNTLNLFSEHPHLNITEAITSRLEVLHLACSVYYSTLQELPAAVRQWWNTKDKPTASYVDKFTSKYCSPVLSADELSSLQTKGIDSENLLIKVRPAAREVLSTYTIQEFSMELLITLPINHPLGPIAVESGKRVGVSNTQWRNWMLQMTTFLNHQNGSIYDGVLLWKKNIDKRFEGVDDCMICFSVIHNSNYQLPRLLCKVCKKKFHSACLYKWFSTSNNSTCPMCRSLF